MREIGTRPTLSSQFKGSHPSHSHSLFDTIGEKKGLLLYQQFSQSVNQWRGMWAHLRVNHIIGKAWLGEPKWDWIGTRAWSSCWNSSSSDSVHRGRDCRMKTTTEFVGNGRHIITEIKGKLTASSQRENGDDLISGKSHFAEMQHQSVEERHHSWVNTFLKRPSKVSFYSCSNSIMSDSYRDGL